MALTFVVSLAAIGLLWATLCNCELTAKRTRAMLRALRRQLDARVVPATDGSPHAGARTGELGRRQRTAAPAMQAAGGLASPAPRGGV
jgi:hypothetical protein